MKFSYSLSQRFSFPILAMQFLIIHSVSSLNLTNEYLNHKCLFNQGKYNSGSEYEKNLNWVFHYIRTRPFENVGFSHTSNGTTTSNFATVVLQCRGDSYGSKSYGSKCRTCLDTAILGFRKRCPSIKGGMIWYDQCFLYVSTVDIENPSRTNYENVFSMHNPNNVKEDAKLFAKRVLDFFSELTLKVEKTTSDGFRIILYAAGEKKLGKNTLYAMVQCLELTMDCKNCLTWSTTKLFKNDDIKQGARVFGSNCDVRIFNWLGNLEPITQLTCVPSSVSDSFALMTSVDC
ncbi:unnamed protein product [Brassica rapa]|uniref:Gnk2-homologous domain-containing protein n=1 Tax=Brassica campestris TaxID=3711 RepID=A0A3P5Z8Q7_BRACM|nr:unnamed protein product [Brassica rapa]VDC70463.1 unnamed protein product [Brassica rapa]